MRGKQAHPIIEGLYQVSADRSELYICRPPEIIRVPILVQPSEVDNDIPEESEMEMELREFKGGREGSLSGMQAEDLEGWCQEAKHKKDPEGRMWELVVILVQVMFRDGTVPEEIAWVEMFLLTKGKV